MGSTAGTTGADGRLGQPEAAPPHGTQNQRNAARLGRLRDIGLLDGACHPSLDRLARAAAHQLRTPRAQVSLIAADRRVVAGRAGPPVEHTLCRLVVDADAPLLVGDARTDERVCGHPAVADGVLAYAGFPLRGEDGYPLGAFCVLDDQPREWEPRDLLLIEDLAAAAETEIALRAAARDHAAAARRLRAVLDGADDAYVSIDVYGVVLAWNGAAERLFGHPAADAIGRPVADLIIPDRFQAAHAAGLARLHNGGRSTLAGQRIELTGRNRAGAEFPVEMILQIVQDDGDPVYHAFLHDISDRLADRRQLEHDRTFLQALLDSLDAGVVACDADGRLTLFNRAMRDIHPTDVRDLDPELVPETLGLYEPDGRTLLRPQDVPLFRAYAGRPVDGQRIVVAPPGAAPRDFHVNGRSIVTPDGRRLGAVVALHDVTDQRRAELLRDLQLAVARALADATSAQEAADRTVEAVARAMGWAFGEFWQPDDGAGTIARVGHWVSPEHDLSAVTLDRPFSVARGTGLAGHIWQSGTELWIPEVADDPRTILRAEQVRQAGLHGAVGLPVRSDDRILGVLLFFSTRIEEPDEELTGLLDGVCAHLGRHIERRRAEDLALALAAARRHLERVIEQVKDYVWTVEIRPDGSIGSVYAGPDGSAVFGEPLPIQYDMTASMTGRVHPGDEAVYQDFLARIRNGEAAETEIRLIGPDRAVRWVWTRAMPRTEAGRLLVDGISTNVTERRELAEQREQLLADQRAQNEQLRHLDRLKDELVALVSHELRNPLGAIRSYSETLLEDPGLTADQRRLAEVIDRRSAHMQAIVDDLLDLAHLEAGTLHLDPQPTGMLRLVRDVVQAQRPAADAKSLTVAVEVPRHLTVHADPARLRQVLENLLSNAIKYTPPGGAVTLTAQHTAAEHAAAPHVSAVDGAGDVVLTVADTGIGIPADQFGHLFDRFFRASNAMLQGIKGTGLGLAISKAIVEAHGGRITAEPVADGGTAFTVTLPAA